jgi:hypothetical protein
VVLEPLVLEPLVLALLVLVQFFRLRLLELALPPPLLFPNHSARWVRVLKTLPVVTPLALKRLLVTSASTLQWLVLWAP